MRKNGTSGFEPLPWMASGGHLKASIRRDCLESMAGVAVHTKDTGAGIGSGLKGSPYENGASNPSAGLDAKRLTTGMKVRCRGEATQPD